MILALTMLLALEKPVGDEVKRLGLRDVQVENGRVLCHGTVEGCDFVNCPASGNIRIVNESEAGNAFVLCEGSYGTVLGGPDAVVASDYTGTLEK